MLRRNTPIPCVPKYFYSCTTFASPYHITHAHTSSRILTARRSLLLPKKTSRRVAASVVHGFEVRHSCIVREHGGAKAWINHASYRSISHKAFHASRRSSTYISSSLQLPIPSTVLFRELSLRRGPSRRNIPENAPAPLFSVNAFTQTPTGNPTTPLRPVTSRIR